MIQKEWFAMAITGLLYAGILAGLIISADLRYLGGKFNARRRLWTRRRAGRPEGRLDRHLRQLLLATVGASLSPGTFKAASAAIFLVFAVTGCRNIAPAAALPASAAIGMMPYLILRIRLETLRQKVSYEGETLVSCLLNQYRIRHFNIYETIENVISQNIELKNTRKLLFRLLIALRNTGSESAVKDATSLFSYSINTNWSRMLANNIQSAAIKGVNVSLALEDILIQLSEARVLAEERKRLNSEAVRMTVFMVPLMYAVTIVMTVVYLDLPIGKYLKNQFYTPEGFTLFMMIVFLFLINVMLIEIVQNQRFDY